MNVLAQVAALLAAAVHVLIFCMESLWFRRPQVYRRFGVRTAEHAEVLRPIMFNQGFYNLFLAAGAAGGVVWLHTGEEAAGRTLVVFSCACMALAGMVLVATDRRFLRASLIQAVPPLLALVTILVT